MRTLLQITAGFAIIALVVLGASTLTERRTQEALPPGWNILREPGEISALMLRDGVAWAGGRDGVTLIDQRTRTVLPTPAALSALRYVRAIRQDAQGTTWIAHGSGITRSTPQGWQTTPSEAFGLTGAIYCLYPEASGAVWIGGEAGLVRWTPDRTDPVDLPETSGVTSVSMVFRDRAGRLWIGSDSHVHGGLLSYSDADGGTGYSLGEQLFHSSVNDILEDHNGTLWVATGFAGHGAVSLLRDGAWTRLVRGEETDGRKARSVYEDRSGRIWLGFEYDGVSVLDQGRWRDLGVSDGLAGEEVKVVRQDDQGGYWIGTANGLSIIGPGAWPAD